MVTRLAPAPRAVTRSETDLLAEMLDRDGARIYTVELPLTSINRAYRIGRGRDGSPRFHGSRDHASFRESAHLALRAAGVRRCRQTPTTRPARYWLWAASLRVSSRRLDIDASVKATLDAFADATGVSDHWCARLDVRLRRDGDADGVAAVFVLMPVRSRGEWDAAAAALDACTPRPLFDQGRPE